ncbi:hypothetical protein Vadar_025919 [Vaccinium darrowii]|uniref:Uncharacterized protein n=1 Tax=Vaccinium darrowii TaxID=229202 RepID=A0ACB7YRU0_9ERIC|nr:hypothetical protein Vadar_025919 [Vaccinium darrowii]
MPAYHNAIAKGVSTVMISYSSWNGVKMHANHKLITKYLKNKLRFRGFVISDWEGLYRITTPWHTNYTYSVLTGIKAGIDMEMVPFNYTEFIDTLTSLEHRELAREAVRKTEEWWTITWQGLSGNSETIGTTILDGIKKTVDPTTQIVYNENPDSDFVKSGQFSYAIVLVGEPPYAEYFGIAVEQSPGPFMSDVCELGMTTSDQHFLRNSAKSKRPAHLSPREKAAHFQWLREDNLHSFKMVYPR